MLRLATGLGYIPEATDVSLSFDDVVHQQRIAGDVQCDWLQERYDYSELHGCYIVRGTGDERYPADAVAEHRMHPTKLAALMDPDRCFDALRHAFHVPT